MRHVGFGRIIEIDLNRAGAQHHIKPHAANTRHVAKHYLVTPFGHDRQLGTSLVGPKTKAQKTLASLVANCLHLLQMPPGFGTGLVQVFQRRARQFELASRFKADRAVLTLQRNNITVFVHRFPAELGHRH